MIASLKNLGPSIRQAREAAGLAPLDIDDRTNGVITAAMVTQIETGMREPTASEVQTLIHAIGPALRDRVVEHEASKKED
jgi:ribosome-binding protein aMBF1 (putative translation factor)